MEIKIRKAKSSDINCIEQLETELQKHEKLNYPVRKSAEVYGPIAAQNMIESMKNNELDIFIAELFEENKIICVGLIAGHKSNETCDETDSYYIEDLAVAEKYRGIGIGTKLLDFMKKFAKKNGYPRLSIGVLASNNRVLEYYIRYGFKTYGIEMEMDI